MKAYSFFVLSTMVSIGLCGVPGGSIARTIETETSKPFLVAYGADSREDDEVVAFVGEKISVDVFEPDADPDVLLIDAAFRSRYRVLQVVRGEYAGDTIEFTAYDHYGEPSFSKYEHVLLFVRRHEKGYIHVKYQYAPLFRTEAHGFAECALKDPAEADKQLGIEPIPMRFDRSSSVLFEGLRRSWVKARYRPEFYEFVAGKARCRLGYTAQQAFLRWVARRAAQIIPPAKP